MGKSNELIRERVDDTILCYKPTFFHTEQNLAQLIESRINYPVNSDIPRVRNWLERFTKSRKVGLTEHQQAVVEMAAYSKIAVLTGGPGTGKCVTGHTLIRSGDSLIRIADFMPEKLKGLPDSYADLEISVKNRKGDRLTSHFYYGGLRETLKVVTDSGYSIEGTQNHRVIAATQNGPQWMRLDELNSESYVAI